MPPTEFVNTKDYIRELEGKVDFMEERIRELLETKLTNAQGKKYSKKELREQYQWDNTDCFFSDTIMAFVKEYLFPRFKFLGSNWAEEDWQNRNSLSSLVKRKVKIPQNYTLGDAWNRIITPTIAKKYADMRCSINNDVRVAYMGEFPCDRLMWDVTQW